LAAGWHIFLSQATDRDTQTTTHRILRLKWVGKRIPENQPGYRPMVSWNEDWEVVAEFITDWWYTGEAFGDRGVYNPEYGFIVDGIDRPTNYGYDWLTDSPNYDPDHYWHYSRWLEAWDDGHYRFQEYCPRESEGVAPSPVMEFLAAWPGTTDNLYNAYYQGESVDDWPETRLCGFSPDSKTDEQPWRVLGNTPPYARPWIRPLFHVSPFYYLRYSYQWTSNFLIFANSFDHSHYYTDQGHYQSVITPRDYIVFQAPGRWITLNSVGAAVHDEGHNPISLLESRWDWRWDCSCAEQNFAAAYVRRKSDGSIWKFRNYNHGTRQFTEIFDLVEKPISPTPGIEYASFFMNGPPIPGNETWNTLMVLK
jgi:hypothetical protein